MIEKPLHLSIATAIREDAQQLAALHAEALPPGWSAAEIAAYCGRSSRLVLKSSHGNDLLGFAVLQFAADEAEILTIAVRRASRRQGIGRSLMDAGLRICREKLIACIYLEVAEGNNPGRRLYEKVGFEVFARRENYYQSVRRSPEAALIMKLNISPITSQIDLETRST